MENEKKIYISTKTVHLDNILHQECKDLADKDNTTLQDLVNTGLRDYVNRKKQEDFFG